MTEPLRTALVGCGNMGRGVAKHCDALPDYTIVAGCDLAVTPLTQFAEIFPRAKTYADFDELLARERPDVVVVATNNAAHAALTIRAAEAGVRGIYCEKPMATNLADGQAMVEACEENGVALAVNHQRRLLPSFRTVRRLMEEGAIGEVELIRGSCAGDLLSDGTHLIDTIRYLAVDAEVTWVFGQIYRAPVDPSEPRGMGFPVSGGWRYGHPVETGAIALIEFETGLRAEMHTGAMQVKGRAYQDYEIFGTRGRIHRAGDRSEPVLGFQTDDRAGWQSLTVEPDQEFTQPGLHFPILASLHQFARTIHDGEAHPLNGRTALKDLEVLMAIHESARLRTRVELPLHQPRYPLEILLEEGQL